MSILSILFLLQTWNTNILYVPSNRIEKVCNLHVDNAQILGCFNPKNPNEIVVDYEQKYLPTDEVIIHEFAHKVVHLKSVNAINLFFVDEEEVGYFNGNHSYVIKII